MKKTNQFKTESKKLLHLMTHSIYTQKEIFLRELISNSSDAIDKRHYLSLTDEQVGSADYKIIITLNKDEHTISIKDNGIGFTEEELIENLGTIAQSGSKSFMEKLDSKDVDIIGQFGVGFYSSFIVSDEVVVKTKSPYSDMGYLWRSNGVDTYTIEAIDKEEVGTEIILYLRKDEEENEENEEKFSQFLEDYEIKSLVKKYSDYVRYPIYLASDLENTLNQMTPIWKKDKNEITDEALNAFYKHQFNDYEEPLKTIHTKVEGLLEYQALLFIPKRPPYDFYSESYEKGLQLYSKGVFIQDKNKDLISDHFKFVKGLVDSSDLSLNISRELLQHDKQLKKIQQNLDKKIKSELERMLESERELYVSFYEAYKNTLKYGIYNQFGLNKDLLQDLLLFKTSQSDDYITLKEYVSRKKENQKDIYYATGKTKQAIMNLPQMDVMKEEGFEVLFFTDEIDEFMIQVMMKYEDMNFKSIQTADLDVASDKKKKEIDKKEKEAKDILGAIKGALNDKVSDVKLSRRLKDAPVCLVSGEGISLEMEKVLKQMPNQSDVKASKILEINPDHPIFVQLKQVFENDATKLDKYASILYHQALLIEGYPIEDPSEFAKNLTDLMLEKM
ncbi:Heat shock protein HtpG [Paracholeplasma brassicae]|uniref:Chaperone protein HtpG n=1 Tax=Acholeplasma brassicae TaxID=61635 RepID=U4KQ19_9MOLU|nr:molecular chaperone HtpG [Paracholeplasma brassicae]CCV66505.1 Heat shock protein HtpG [Paracholeplasma brassicae]